MAMMAELNGAIYEYLRHNDLDSTAREFASECERRGVALGAWAAPNSQEELKAASQLQQVVERMGRLFSEGRRTEFFELWAHHIPSATLARDTAVRIGFYANVHFAIWPIHPANPARNRALLDGAMSVFRAYTEASSAELARNPEYLAFYALPFVPNPD
jgi:hypothetical protein